MSETQKVKITSAVKHKVTVSAPELRFSRTWPGYGSSVTVEKEVLEDLMYDPGFKNMILLGILSIEDLQVKKDLGLEPEDATEPVNIITLNDSQRNYYWKELSVVGFKDKIRKLSRTQLEELAEYAIDHRIIDVDKCKLIQEACGRDVITAIRLVEQNKED